MKRVLVFFILPILFLCTIIFVWQRPYSTHAAPSVVQAPVLKWQHKGCFNSWCETGWYSSPAVADIDDDGQAEVIASAYSIVALNGATGALEWRVKSGHDRSEGTGPDNVGRTWPGVVTADVDNDGDLEIVTAHGGGYVSVYNHQGYFAPGWPKRPSTSELRGLSVHDIDNNGDMEIIVTAAVGNPVNTWIYEHTGALRGGWPQLSNSLGYAHGVFNDNAAIGDIDNDGTAEIVVPSDVHYINAYENNGTHIPANAIYGNKTWGQTGVHVDHDVDIRGWANCGTEHRPNFAHTPAAIADVNRDGTNEVIAMGNVYSCVSGYPSLYEMAFIFNGDRTRWAGSGYDWEVIPSPTGNASPISEDYGVIESNMSNPVIADLDGDGMMEILFPSYDGRLHAYWLDKQEKHNWPYEVYSGGIYRFASEPVVADLDNDGKAEVIFTTWVQKDSNTTGQLRIVDYQGNLLQSVGLPSAFGSPDWNGAMAAPTLANLDNDADLEVVINTAHSGFVAYDLPGTANARILWGTGRGNYQRTGSFLDLQAGGTAVPGIPEANDTLTYTIKIQQPAQAFASVSMTSTLPAEVTYLGSLTATSGQANYSGGVITWQGDVKPSRPVTIQFAVTVKPSVTTPTPIINPVQFNDGLGNVWTHSIVVIANGEAVYLPAILK